MKEISKRNRLTKTSDKTQIPRGTEVRRGKTKPNVWNSKARLISRVSAVT